MSSCEEKLMHDYQGIASATYELMP